MISYIHTYTPKNQTCLNAKLPMDTLMVYSIYKKKLNGWWLNGGLDNYQQNCTFINGFWMQNSKNEHKVGMNK